MSQGNSNRCRGVMQESRQGMYKLRSPAWKETYRSRCLERLRENRSKCHALRRRNIYDCHLGSGIEDEEEEPVVTLDGCRGDGKNLQSEPAMLSIEEIMEQEWKGMSRELEQTRQRRGSGDTADPEYVDSMVSLYEEICSELRREIQTDLRKEEEHLLRLQQVCDVEVQYQEDELCSAVQSLSTDEVICPLCEKSSLIENKGVILCTCGLRIDTEQDCISLRNIRVSLQAGASEHSGQCEAKPEFSLSQRFGITNILMSCQECDFLFIIV